MNPHTEAMLKANSSEMVPYETRGELARVSDFTPIFSIAQAVALQKQMSEFIGQILKPTVDYGMIPGASKEKVLLKPGAEKLCKFFGLSPQFVEEKSIEDWTGADHGGEPLFYYRYKCQLWRGPVLLGEAVGSCNSWEKKYRWRNAARVCPACGVAALIMGKPEFERDERYKGGFICFGKKGGCGAKFTKDDKAITTQEVGQVKNPDVADVINTCQKIAQKRALVAAVLIGTNASDSFTQDVDPDELPNGAHAGEHQDAPEPEKTPKPQAPAADRSQPAETQAQVRDRRIAEEQAKSTPAPAMTVGGSAVPEELVMVFRACDTKKGLDQARDLIYVEMDRVLGGARSGEIWRDVNKKYAITTKSAVSSHRAAMLEMWNTMLAEAPAKETA